MLSKKRSVFSEMTSWNPRYFIENRFSSGNCDCGGLLSTEIKFYLSHFILKKILQHKLSAMATFWYSVTLTQFWGRINDFNVPFKLTFDFWHFLFYVFDFRDVMNELIFTFVFKLDLQYMSIILIQQLISNW